MRICAQPRLIVTALLLFLSAPRIVAQQSGNEFTSIQFGLGPVLQANTTDIDTAWKSGTGIELFLAMPFYLGDIQVGFQLIPHSVITPGVPRFISRYLYLDWRMPVRIVDRLHWSGAIRLGVVQLSFKVPDASWHGTTEHELGTGFMTSLDWAFLDNWSARISAVRRKTWFFKPLHQTFISFSILRRFASPEWLRELLR